ncbi:MAG: hypothetical protein D6718_11575, partial [Acidobacteria bacterium]
PEDDPLPAERDALARRSAAVHPAAPRPPGVADPAIALAAIRLARRHRVSVRLARVLEGAGALATLPPEAARELRRDVLRAQSARVRLERALRAVAGALAEAGVPLLLLKGAAVAALAYDDPAEREMSDVDVLVAPDALGPALDVLRRAGLSVPEAETVGFWREVYFNVPVTSAEDQGAKVEIHWSIAQTGRHTPDIEGMLARSRPVRFGGVDARAPAAADLFLHQALHLGYHYFQPRLSWLIDIARLASREPQPWADLERRARAWGMCTTLRLALAHVERVFPGTLPEDLARAARGSLRARWLPRILRTRDPAALVAGWSVRPVQLLLAAATLDRPAQAGLAVASWFGRVVRHGDRAGHRRL